MSDYAELALQCNVLLIASRGIVRCTGEGFSNGAAVPLVSRGKLAVVQSVQAVYFALGVRKCSRIAYLHTILVRLRHPAFAPLTSEHRLG
jgi:hypothetical protein